MSEARAPSHAELFERWRTHLFGVAYRMLGRVTLAEDAVQDAYERWQRVDLDAVASPRAYLTTIVTRRCLDELRSARTRRETYVGPWLPEPIVSRAPSPAQKAERADAVSVAFLVLLETLTPVQRAVFLLRDVFGYEYDAIAPVVDRTAAHCRKIAQRARQHVRSQAPRFEAAADTHEALLQRFTDAVETGNMEALLATLADDAVLYSDGGGQVVAATKPIYGADRIARFLLGIARKAPPGLIVDYARVNDRTGLVAHLEDHLQSVWSFDAVDGRIRRIYVVLNPDKLTRTPDRPA